MTVRPIRPSDLPAVSDLYCRVTVPLAHGFAPTKQELADAFSGKPINHTASVTLVCEHRGGIVGLARVGRHAAAASFWTRASEGDGLLFGPLFAPGDDEAACALIRAADEHVRSSRGSVRFAFEPGEAASLRFYNGGWMGCSDQLPHVQKALLAAGFRIVDRELNLTLTDAVHDFVEPVGIALRLSASEENRFDLTAYCGERVGGTCHFSRMYPRRSRNPEAEGWGYIDGLGVEEDLQRRGIGRALLVQAIRKLREVGCAAICLTTGQANLRAQNLYFSLGFRLVGSSVALERPMEAH